ncbi:MAG TPA: hypothetical protein VGQ46_18395 [Thermoanaerobaculia bacterium]|nr:hypothetical protein [Thermoanaerobaculia bacterium]
MAFATPVRYCIVPRIQQAETRIQVLVDGSGSMDGIRDPVLRYVRWIEQGISRSRGAAGNGPVRIAQFDRRRGIESSADFAAFDREYKATGETTLHAAIASSADWDVTYILTDGVDAAGSGNGECAAGVDAACVARAFEQALLHPHGPSAGELPGLWVLPLRTTHDGIYYTERPVAPSRFDSNQLKQELLALYPPPSTGSTTRIDVREPAVDKAGNLKYSYYGPRSLLLIVIARSDEIGRATVASLVEVAAQNGVTFSDVGSSPVPDGLEAFRPIEVYPGWVPPVDWSALIASDATRPSGTIDVSLNDHASLVVDCPPQKHGEADYLLSADAKAPSSRCVDLYQLPQFEYQLVTREGDQSAISKTVPVFSRESTASGDRLTLHVACDNGGDRPCASNPIHASYVAARRFDLGFATAQTAVGAAHQIESLSTDDPVRQPHRIYGFRQLMSFFYDDVASQKLKPAKLADMLICNGRGK